MIRVLFVCHGNICRSPMAEFVFRKLAREAGLEDRLEIASAATSTEELGSDLYPPARRKLRQEGVPFTRRQARQITRRDYDQYDWLIGMDSRNIANMRRAFGGDPAGKIVRLLDLTPLGRDVADPWYTGDFDAAYDDILAGCKALLTRLQAEPNA